MMSGEERKIVYISHPLRPDPTRSTRSPRRDCNWNIEDATTICERLLRERSDLLVLSPIHAFGFVDPLCDKKTTELVLEQCRRLLELADELWVYGEYETSEGCRMEIAYAEKLGKPVILQEPEG